MFRTYFLIPFVALALAGLARAQEAPESPQPEPHQLDFDFGFDEEEQEGIETDRRRFTLPLRGAFVLEGAHGTGAGPRWHKAGPAARFVGDWSGRLGQLFGEATLRHNQSYRWEGDPQNVVDARSLEGVVRELYWKKSFERWSVTAGNAIVVWGEGDILTPSDVVTRRDTSLLLFEYPAASRLGQNIAQMSFYPNAHDQIDLLFVPKALSDRVAPEGHPDALFGAMPIETSRGDNEIEVGVQWKRRFTTGELAVHGGYFHERRGMFAPRAVALERSVPGYGFFGVSGHRVLGPIVWRGELALSRDRAHQRWSVEGPAGFERRDHASGLIAADIASSRWGRLSLELGLASGNPYAFDSLETADGGLLTSVAANWLRTFLRESVRTQASVVWRDGLENVLARFELGYRPQDVWELTGKLTSLNDGALWGNSARQTRVEIDVSYSFDLSRTSP